MQMSKTKTKPILICFFDIKKIIHHEFLKSSQPFYLDISECYTNTLVKKTKPFVRKVDFAS
jgi:hypothetical protein